NVISILMFVSPIKTFKMVVKKKSTENYKGIPYITTLLSTSLWTFYGLLKPGGLLVVTVNSVGAALHVVYVLIFLSMPQKHQANVLAILSKTKVRSVKLVAALNFGFLGAVIIVTLLALRGGMRLTLVGLLCAGLTIGMYAAPLSAMRTVMKMKSVKYMPFFVSFFQFLNGAVWSAYAVLEKDYYMGVPNGIGFLLGSAQLILYTIYRSKAMPEESEERMEEEGSADLFKGAIQMQGFDEDDQETSLKNRSLNKGNSLPKPSVVRQYSHNIVKTLSLNPYELQKVTGNDVEEGLMESR
ncbi:Bidirectional sugar transporter SWEET16, partial [Sesamum angolense]